MRKFDNELNYLYLIILLGKNDLDILFFIFRNEINIKSLNNSVI